jgi:uncharacterized membrane protein
MDKKTYLRLRAGVALFVGMIVSIATVKDSYLLAAAGVITGMIFMALVRSKAKIKVDEREVTIRQKAAQLTYAIFAPTIGIGAFLMLFPTSSKLSVFSKGDFVYLESLGMIFAYLTLFLITIYALSYHFIGRRYGGGNDEE